VIITRPCSITNTPVGEITFGEQRLAAAELHARAFTAQRRARRSPVGVVAGTPTVSLPGHGRLRSE
jgi:hypothetical protein